MDERGELRVCGEFGDAGEGMACALMGCEVCYGRELALKVLVNVVDNRGDSFIPLLPSPAPTSESRWKQAHETDIVKTGNHTRAPRPLDPRQRSIAEHKSV